MKPDDIYYRITPRIVPAGESTTFRVLPLYDHARFDTTREFSVLLYPMELANYNEETKRSSLTEWYFDEQGAMIVKASFGSEQEYILEIKDRPDHTYLMRLQFRIYALETDLFVLRPYKGDFHIHSTGSDGKEAPAYVVAAARREGLDFCAITDHRRYEPSVEAVKAFEGVRCGIHIHPGEEIHPPENPVHMVNFGGKFSINLLWQGESYLEDVRKIEESLTDVPDDVNSYHYASCKYCADKIREGGGVALLAHPYWHCWHGYNVSVPLQNYLFEKGDFDCFEIVGGNDEAEIGSNYRQIALYDDQVAKGNKCVPVSVSDGHGCESGRLFGWYYTVIFATGPDMPELAKGIREMRTAAIARVPGQHTQVYGPLRYVKYALFLEDYIFPAHDEIAREEGRQLFRHIQREPDAAGKAETLAQECSDLMASYWKRGVNPDANACPT
jgi:hypothetical protein